MALTKVTSGGITDSAITSAKINDGAITNDDIKSDAAITAGKLSATLDLSSKTITLPASSVTAHATTPTLDSPSITGTLFVDDGSTVSHTISNWSDDITYVITPTNCTVGSVNSSGVFVVTHTSGTPSYTIKATTDSLGLADSSVVTKNIVLSVAMTAPSLNAPADSDDATAVTYTISSIDSNATKVIFDAQSSNFTYGSVGSGSGSKVGNTVEITGWSGTSVTVTLTYTTAATYSNRANVTSTSATYTDSAYSSADSIVISSSAVAATGGTIVTSGGYKYHTFTSSGNLVVSTGGDVDYLVVAGGGGGGDSSYGASDGWGKGGGGAGGYRTFAAQSISAGTHSVVIGAGAAVETKGSNTTFNSHATTGGGPGSDGSISSAGAAGGSGGGQPHYRAGGPGNQGGYTPVEGHDGVGSSGSGDNSYGGGGGGAGATGVQTAGGIGSNSHSSWATATSTGDSGYYAGGGGGGRGSNAAGTGAGAGGTGGGGNGEHGSGQSAGSANTGGGGGGGGSGEFNGSAGGSGIVIVRYAV